MSHSIRLLPDLAPLSRPLSPTRRLLRVLLLGIALVAVAAAAIELDLRRAAAISDAVQRADDTSRLLEENVRGMVRATGFIVGEAVRTAGDDSRLAALEAALPDRGRLVIYDADGRLAQPAALAAAQAGMAPSGPFQAHKQGTPAVIGSLEASPLTGQPAFTISRRINGADGSFAGIGAAVIDANGLDHLFEGLDLGPGANIGVFRLDGTTVLRLPNPEKYEHSNVNDGPVMRAVAGAPQGHARGASPLDGVERIVAYRTLPDLGVIVACGISIEDAMAGWRREAMMIIVGLAALAIPFILLALFAFRNLDREGALLRELEDKVRERTEEAHRQAEEAKRADEGKTRFLACASHDLRQPLQAAGMFVEVLASRLADTPHEPVVEKLRRSIEATGTLLTALLDISTLESGKIKPAITAFPLMPLLATLVDQMEPDAAERRLGLSVVATSAWVVSDRVLLERLLRNLMVNAIRYTEKGGVLVGCRRRGNEVAIAVVDTGVGIPADKLEAIFEDFTRLEAVRGSARRGPGLGLGVVRHTARLLGHKIEVRSTLGHGSTFTVIVPAAPIPAPTA